MENFPKNKKKPGKNTKIPKKVQESRQKKDKKGLPLNATAP